MEKKDYKKRLLLRFYIHGIEDESWFRDKWKDLPFLGRYRRIKKFLIYYSKIKN